MKDLNRDIGFNPHDHKIIMDKAINLIQPKKQPMKDLTKILRDGDEVYSIIHGEMVKISKYSVSHYPFVIEHGDYARVQLSKYGGYYGKGDGECLIFPSKEERDWDNFKRKEEFKRGDLCMFWDDGMVKVIGMYYGYDHYSDSHISANVSSMNKVESGFYWDNCEKINIEDYLK